MGARRNTDNRGLGPDNSVSMATSVPDRVRWAVEALDIQPNERLLEFGPGPALRLGHWSDPNTAHSSDRRAFTIDETAWRFAPRLWELAA